MSKYHSTLSRREFLKVIGLGGAGAASAAVMPPVFRDIDEMISSPLAEYKRPYWVKTVNKPTVEIDWPAMGEDPYDGADCMLENGFVKALGAADAYRAARTSDLNRALWIEENKPGYTMRDWALNSCNQFYRSAGYQNPGIQSFLGTRGPTTLKSMGFPQYEGTPEENARMIRAFLKMHGCAGVSFCELETNTTEKILYKCDAGGAPYIIRDQDNPEEVTNRGEGNCRVIPKKARYVIVYTIRMSEELLRYAPTYISNRTAFIAYELQCLIQNWLQNFLHALGYMCLGWHRMTSSLGSSVGFGVMAGLGETGRTMHLITPEHGQTEKVFCAITDLPLAPGKPVDFGVVNYCKTCKKCAENCPAGAISKDTEPSWEKRGFYARSGVRTWYRNEVACRANMYRLDNSCGICVTVCPFSKLYKAPYYQAMRSVSANTTMFNRLFRKAGDIFNFGARRPEDYEKLWGKDIPPFGWE